MAWSQEISQLITEVDQLTDVVNIKKQVLDAAVDTAVTAAENSSQSASQANISAGQSAGASAAALAIYGSAEAQQAAVANAQNQASLAAGHAASAASVVQQDLSGVTAHALHRSPNAVTAMFIYDTSKDSDGGAWTEKCQHTSWWNEPINGKWLGPQASEAAARAVSGATAGDYFQRSTDGRFYRLNAGSGITEVFRGNKRDFPRLAGIVADLFSVTIYDLTEPGRPMWMRFVGSSGNNIISGGSSTNCVFMSNGTMFVGFTGGLGVSAINFPADAATKIGTTGETVSRPISTRHDSTLVTPVATSAKRLINGTVQAIAMTVLHDAPVDPVTGLRVPTIAVATDGGVSVVLHDGTVQSQAFLAGAARSVRFDGRRVLIGAITPGSRHGAYVWDLSDNTTQDYGWTGVVQLDPNTGTRQVRTVGQNYAALQGGAELRLLRHNKTPSRSILARVANTFNTGWMAGDIRRCLLSDTEVGSVTGPELVTNGTFDVDASGWTLSSANVTATRNASGQLEVTNNGVGWVSQTINTVAGKTYRVEVNWLQKQGSGRFNIGTTVGGTNLLSASGAGNYTGTAALTFVASGTTAVISMGDVSGGAGTVQIYDNISVREVVFDRSYKNASATINGTLTRAQLASGTSLVGYSGFSSANYLREPYSADLDFGTGEWTASAWVNVPATLPLSNFPVIGSELVTNGTFDTDTTGWFSFQSATLTWQSGSVRVQGGYYPGLQRSITTEVGKFYRLSANILSVASGAVFGVEAATSSSPGTGILGFTLTAGSGEKAVIFLATSTTTWVRALGGSGSGYDFVVDDISVQEVGPAIIADRAHSSGPRLRLGVTGTGRLTAEAFDGTTTRTVTTSASYNTAQWLKARVNYTTDGTLAILVNGREVAATRGAPLLTLNNSNATLTIGNSFALDAPFPGSIALLKLGVTVPTPEQAVFMYEQEKQLFRAGALSVLPDSGAIVDMSYDDVTDRWVAVSASNESYWTGLVRNSVTPVPAGSYTRVATTSGVELISRSTTNPGVDVTIPPYGLREELVKRAEAAARLSRLIATYDYVGGFTGNITTGSTAIASVTNLTYPTSYIGARISGTGIPVNAFITGVSGTTIYISAPASATTTGVSISFLDFILPVGQEAKAVMSAGTIRREGSTADYTRLYDGFKETIRFATAPGATTWVQIQSTRIPQ